MKHFGLSEIDMRFFKDKEDGALTPLRVKEAVLSLESSDLDGSTAPWHIPLV